MSRVKGFFFLSLRTSFLYFISEPKIHHRSYSNRLILSLLILGAFRSGVMQESYPRNNFPYFDFLLQIIKTIKRNFSDPLYQSKFPLKQLWTRVIKWTRAKIVPCRPAFKLEIRATQGLTKESIAFEYGFSVWFIIIRAGFIERRRKNKTKVMPATNQNKVYIIISQWELKTKTRKLLNARENADDRISIVLSFATDWLRGWCRFLGPITEKNQAKP